MNTPPSAVGGQQQRLQRGGQRECERDLPDRLPAEQGGNAGDRSAHTDAHQCDTCRQVADARGRHQRQQDGQRPEQRLGEQPGVHQCGESFRSHRPVTFLSAAAMASGVGGQPGTCTSTSTKSSTDPATA